MEWTWKMFQKYNQINKEFQHHLHRDRTRTWVEGGKPSAREPLRVWEKVNVRSLTPTSKETLWTGTWVQLYNYWTSCPDSFILATLFTFVPLPKTFLFSSAPIQNYGQFLFIYFIKGCEYSLWLVEFIFSYLSKYLESYISIDGNLKRNTKICTKVGKNSEKTNNNMNKMIYFALFSTFRVFFLITILIIIFYFLNSLAITNA